MPNLQWSQATKNGAYNQIVTCLEGDLWILDIIPQPGVKWDILLQVYYIAYGDKRFRQNCCLLVIWGKCNIHIIFVLDICMQYNFPSICIQEFDVMRLLRSTCHVSVSSWVSIVSARFSTESFRSTFHILTLLSLYPTKILWPSCDGQILHTNELARDFIS